MTARSPSDGAASKKVGNGWIFCACNAATWNSAQQVIRAANEGSENTGELP